MKQQYGDDEEEDEEGGDSESEEDDEEEEEYDRRTQYSMTSSRYVYLHVACSESRIFASHTALVG